MASTFFCSSSRRLVSACSFWRYCCSASRRISSTRTKGRLCTPRPRKDDSAGDPVRFSSALMTKLPLSALGTATCWPMKLLASVQKRSVSRSVSATTTTWIGCLASLMNGAPWRVSGAPVERAFGRTADARRQNLALVLGFEIPEQRDHVGHAHDLILVDAHGLGPGGDQRRDGGGGARHLLEERPRVPKLS